MYTTYSIQKVAGSTHREELTAAEQRRLAREVRRTQTTDGPAITGDTPSIPRQRRFLEQVWLRMAVSGH